jgi:hypothetical protein
MLSHPALRSDSRGRIEMQPASTLVRDEVSEYVPHEHEELLGAARRERERVRRLRLLAKHAPQPQSPRQNDKN